jgi:CDP-diacylglycerol--serine O-phosphatidyltransferase
MMILKFSEGVSTRLLWIISLMFVLCALVRLARFNTQQADENDGHGWFVGLPSPAAAGMIASLLIAFPGLLQLADTSALPPLQSFATWLSNIVPTCLPWFTLLLACLMVSRIRYPHSVEQFRQGKRVVVHLATSYIALLAISYVHELALPILFFIYVLGGPLRAFAWLASPIITRQVRPVLR